MRDVFSIHDELVLQAEAEGIQLETTLLSNGVNLSEWEIGELDRRKIAVMISLDGIGKMHDDQRKLLSGKGSFSRVIKTINKLRTRGIHPHISVTVTSLNLEGVPDLVKYLLQENLSFSLNYYRITGTEPTDLSLNGIHTVRVMRKAFKLIEQHLPKDSLLEGLLDRANLAKMHNYTCGSGRNYIAIDHNGWFSACQMDLANPVINTQNKDVILLLQDKVSGKNLPVDLKENCKTCAWRYWCTGGCPLASYKAFGRSNVPSPNCFIYASLIPDILRLEGLRLLKYTDAWFPESQVLL
jgi:uncharacterized protein